MKRKHIKYNPLVWVEEYLINKYWNEKEYRLLLVLKHMDKIGVKKKLGYKDKRK